MELTKQDIAALRNRLKKTDRGIKGAAEEGGITEATAHKILRGDNCKEESIKAFLDGVGLLEASEQQKKKSISVQARQSPIQTF
ncbi:hypothetical protein [Tellurirhabdus bombi]|uniref:hypothetical protein n=1 Tax=Tellurirhabdus bombi TaxID=2907205 RepID=UPI001F323202|nr:hypothetical protein [Tellurirhabdus bombi]